MITFLPPLRGYGEAPGSTVGSVVCTVLDSGRSCEAVDVSHIHFSPLPEATIEMLIEGACVVISTQQVRIHI